MANCIACGMKGHGVRGHVLEHSCVTCSRVGCEKCMPLTHIIYEKDVAGGVSGTIYGKSQVGTCSPQCYQLYWFNEVKTNPSKILSLPFIPVYGPEVYPAHMLRITMRTKVPTQEDINVMSKYLEKPLSQGVTMMYMGYKTLDHGKITDGLRLCRNDPVYEWSAKAWVDNLAAYYVQDLRRMDVPTSRTSVGGVTISLSVPKGQSEMKLLGCPSCGAGLNQIAVRGQTVMCSYCNSSFEVT